MAARRGKGRERIGSGEPAILSGQLPYPLEQLERLRGR